MFGLFKKKTNDVTFTEEEKTYIKKMFDNFKEYAIKEDVVEKFERGITAKGLELYAAEQEDKVFLRLGSEEQEQDYLINAIAAVHKAYKVYPLPLYLFLKAKYLEQLGVDSDALINYEKYVDAFADYKEEGFDKELLGNYNLEDLFQIAARKTLTL